MEQDCRWQDRQFSNMLANIIVSADNSRPIFLWYMTVFIDG